MQDQAPRPPAGFEPLFRTSPFLDTVGPLFYRKEPDGGFVVGLRVLPKHANTRLAFANAFLVVNGERLVRASAVFSRSGGALPGSASAEPGAPAGQ